MNDSLTELLARCAAGDEGAVEILVVSFQPWALVFAAALLNDKSVAPDIVQESFITALGSLSSLRDPDAFPGWFRQIIRTRVSRANRKRTERRLDENREPVSESPEPWEGLHWRRMAAIVRKAVESLPPASRVTAELHYFGEMKHTDIAEQLGVPIGTVRRRLHDARRTLRAKLRAFADEEPQADLSTTSELGHNHNNDIKWRL